MARNDLTKRGYLKTPYTFLELEELRRCSVDPIYFIENYVYIQGDNGRSLFKPYAYQREMITTYATNRNVICMLARQSGKTAITTAYILWYCMFNEDKVTLIAANVLKQALEIVGKIRYAYESLPDFLRAGSLTYNKGTLEFDNGSRIVSSATTENTGRGMAVNLLYLDEFAFLPPRLAQDFWVSIRPTLAQTRGKCIITSTPNNDQDQFAEIWFAACDTKDKEGNSFPNNTGKNGFRAIKYTWRDNPNRTQQWADEEMRITGEAKFKREHECEFVSNDKTLIDPIKLTTLKSSEPIFEAANIKWFKKPIPGNTYLVGWDPSMGAGGDMAAIQVYQVPNLEQVAEWTDNTTTLNGQVRIFQALLKYINDEINVKNVKDPDIYWSIETNGLGDGAISLVRELGEENFPGIFMHQRRKRGKGSGTKYGFNLSPQNKLLACSDFKNLVETDAIKLHSNSLIRELKFFVSKKGTYEAKWGETDDRVLATLLIVSMSKVLERWEPEVMEPTKNLLRKTSMAPRLEIVKPPIDTEEKARPPLPFIV